MHRTEALLLKAVGILLILLGLVLFASPYVPYTTRERIRDTPLTVKREKTLIVPRAVAVLVIAAGVTVLILPRKNSRQ